MDSRVSYSVAKLHFPGTIHYVIPASDRLADDQIQISEFGKAVRAAVAALCIYILLVGISLISSAVSGLGSNLTARIINDATQPLLAIAVGVFLTFMVQSSTVITTIVVAAVGSGVLPFEMAVMLIMGANIGTCFSAQLVAFSLFRSPQRFESAFAASMTHWWFNVLSVLIFLPIELLFHPLTATARFLTGRLLPNWEQSYPVGNLVSTLVEPVVVALGPHGWAAEFLDPVPASMLAIAIGVLAVFFAVHVFTQMLTQISASNSHSLMERSSNHGSVSVPTRTVLGGLGITLMTHSSSATICATIPFAGTGQLSLRRAFAIVLGANLGTTLTAVLTGLVVTGPNVELATQAGLIHVLFNLIAIILVMLLHPLSRMILWASAQTARFSRDRILLAFLGTLASYTALPLAIIAVLSLY